MPSERDHLLEQQATNSIEAWGLSNPHQPPPPQLPKINSSSTSSTTPPPPSTSWRDRLSSKSGVETWNFIGWGKYDMHLEVSEDTLTQIESEMDHHTAPLLKEWEATAICTNDVLSSCLYTIGLVTISAGKLAPLALLLVSGVLYHIQLMYGEAITALPLNGGCFNVLLNTTSKGIASFGATFALVSYVATGVTSATSAINYLDKVLRVDEPILAIIGLLGFFATLVVMGIKESSRVAEVILFFHVLTLTILCVTSLIYVLLDPSTLIQNLQTPFPDVEFSGIIRSGSFATALFFGYASAILGVSGYESSSQFVQSQAPGVYLKTLHHMWWGSFLYNPLLSFLSLGVLPLETIVEGETVVLAKMAKHVGYAWGGDTMGRSFERWVSIDAFVVLSGALLTAYVGVNGLIERMASDRCLPQFLLTRNKWRRTTHNIIFLYFGLATALVCILEGDVTDLSGVYSFAFLSVLTMFTIGVMLLKFKRPSLPREVVAPWSSVVIAFVMVLLGLGGNLMGNPEVLAVFVLYVGVAGLLVLGMFQWTTLLHFAVVLLRGVCSGVSTEPLERELAQAQSVPAVFFCKTDDVYVINKAMLYLTANEQSRNLIVVHVWDKDRPVPPGLARHIENFDTMYPRIKTTLLMIEGPHFSPEMIEYVSRELNVPKNNMFITAPDSTFKYKLDKLGGVRVITH